MSIFFKINAVNRLANSFSTNNFPNDKAILKTTVQVGIMRYRRCAALCLEKEGLYLRIKFIFKSYPDIFIPWNYIKVAKKSRLYSMKAIQFVLNDPTLPSIKIYEQFFNNHLFPCNQE